MMARRTNFGCKTQPPSIGAPGQHTASNQAAQPNFPQFALRAANSRNEYDLRSSAIRRRMKAICLPSGDQAG